MKAIETEYRGYKFRSRTEARWAVWFDEMDIPFEYEKEGYDLDGTYYLPDFWIDCWDSFVEIKGVEWDKLPSVDKIKVRKLAYHSRKPVIVLSGVPAHKEYMIFEYDPHSDTLFEYSDYLLDTNTDMLLFTEYDAAVKAARSARFEDG